MAVVFLKDHCEYKKGDIVENHPNETYLIRLGVVEQKKSDVPKKEKKPKPE